MSQSDALQTWSVVDPSNVHRTNQYLTGSPRWTDVTVSGDLLWAMGSDTAVFSLADPAVPALLSRSPIPRFFCSETGFGSYLYRSLGYSSFDLFVFDYSIPTAPVAVDTLYGVSGELQSGAGELQVGSDMHLRRFDLSDPAAPVEDAGHTMERILDLAGDAGRGSPLSRRRPGLTGGIR